MAVTMVLAMAFAPLLAASGAEARARHHRHHHHHHHRAVPPLKISGAQYRPLAWNAVAGWRDDDQLAAFNTFRASCKAILAQRPGARRQARALGQSLQQRKPFRRFKDALAAHPAQREAWFAFERQAMEAIAQRWCEEHDISPRWAVRPNRPTP